MKTDLSEMSRNELLSLKSDIDLALNALAEKEKKAALAAAEKAVAAYGFSLAEITGSTNGRKGKAGVKTSAAPKYRNPDDANQTWTGKGRQPGWFKTAIAAGKSPDAMEI